MKMRGASSCSLIGQSTRWLLGNQRCPNYKLCFPRRGNFLQDSRTLVLPSSSSSDELTTCDEIPPDIAALLGVYTQKAPTMISLQEIVDQCDIFNGGSRRSMGRFGQRLASQRMLMNYAELLHDELPVRLAHRIQDLDQVPQLRNMPSVQHVKGKFINSFLQLVETPDPYTPALEEGFSDMLTKMYQDHSNVMWLMAKGAWELKARLRSGEIPSLTVRSTDPSGWPTKVDHRIRFAEQQECHNFLNRFYLSRIGMRVLAGQYLVVRQQLLEEPGTDIVVGRGLGHGGGHQFPQVGRSAEARYIGMICLDTSPYQIVKVAIEDAQRLCRIQYPGEAPPNVRIEGRLNLTFPYLPTHIHYILLELLKNAMRATMEHHAGKPKPDILVAIADHDENEDVVIKVADEGGGIPRSEVNHIWSYLYSSVDPRLQESFLQQDPTKGESNTHILAGLGYGLPMSRAYARYFGGDLDLISMEGYGTDAFCYLVRLGDRKPYPV
eukprot:Nitzschia sp. Nitz4//scaffold158_size52425//33674//35253//NITZ4_006860-RA/size52425-augustus-gene-0.9-mRNA-1//-1//CDS//3329537516//9321//frame0